IAVWSYRCLEAGNRVGFPQPTIMSLKESGPVVALALAASVSVSAIVLLGFTTGSDCGLVVTVNCAEPTGVTDRVTPGGSVTDSAVVGSVFRVPLFISQITRL